MLLSQPVCGGPWAVVHFRGLRVFYLIIRKVRAIFPCGVVPTQHAYTAEGSRWYGMHVGIIQTSGCSLLFSRRGKPFRSLFRPKCPPTSTAAGRVSALCALCRCVAMARADGGIRCCCPVNVELPRFFEWRIYEFRRYSLVVTVPSIHIRLCTRLEEITFSVV